MSELTNHFNKFEETREQLTERTLDESPTKVKQVLNEKQILNENDIRNQKLLFDELKQIILQKMNRLPLEKLEVLSVLNMLTGFFKK